MTNRTSPTTMVLAGILLMSGLPANAAPPQEAAPRCLWLRDILDTHTPDDRTILFRMRGGDVYRNRLKTTCTGLKTFGFGYTTPDDQICDRMMIQVLRNGPDCMLGQFESVAPHSRG